MTKTADKNHPVTMNIRKILKERQLSPEWLAEKSGMMKLDLQKVLDDKRIIRPEEIAQIANALGTDANALFEETAVD